MGPTLALILLAAANLLIICYGLRHSSGALQYPVLISTASLGYIVPEALGVVLNPGLAPVAGLTKSLMMFFLSSVAAYVGWRSRRFERWVSSSSRSAPSAFGGWRPSRAALWDSTA
jgi:hypothetical protein